MSQSKTNTRLCDKTSGKCGEITFCLQVGTRVYALNCLFCSQIYIQWDAFINHMEEKHTQQLRSDHLLQQEIEEVNVDTDNSKETEIKPSVQILEELPQSSKMCIRTEFNDGTSGEALDYNDPLGGNSAGKCASIRATVKTENFYYTPDQSFEIRVVDPATPDQTCDSIEDQMDFNSQLSAPESKRGDEQSKKEDVMEKLETIQRLIFRLLKEMKLPQNNRSQNITEQSILPQQPFENKDAFLNFEGYIKTAEEQFSYLVTELMERVSGNSKKFVNSCWRKLVRDNVAQDFCWQGSPAKMSVKALSTTLAIKLAYNEKYADHSDAEFEKCTIYFFQQAKNRVNKKVFKNYPVGNFEIKK